MDFYLFYNESDRYVHHHNSVNDTYKILVNSESDHIFIVDEYRKPIGVVTIIKCY